MARKEGRFNALADKVPSSDKDKTVTYVTTEKQYHVALYARSVSYTHLTLPTIA